ncbi:MAG: sulfite exporter TauE/SafE family protein [Pseudomonadota bacterium]|nr:sulfite exporter TauE/SafE family protein [Pseudomonadota bacterium]
MESLNLDSLTIVLVAIALGAYLKGAIGLGLPLIAVPTMANFLGVEHAIVVLTIPVVASNIWICLRYRKIRYEVPFLKISLFFAGLGVLCGTTLLAFLSDSALITLLIVWLGLYLFTITIKPDFKLTDGVARFLAPIFAMAGGTCQGATGIAGPIIATWIHAYRLEKKTYVFAVSILFLIISGTHVLAVGSFGLYTQERLIQGVLALIPTILFTQIGMWTTPYISPKWFNRAVIGVIFAMWIKLIFKAYL